MFQIIFIFSNGIFTQPWLPEFDKLITDAKNKEKICEEYNVDILIDDRYTTIEKVINNGKKAIIFDTNWNRNYNKSPRAHNWQEVYNYIKSLEDNNE